jgi:hypothetical protein
MNDKILDIVQPDQYGIKIKGGPEILKHLFQCFFEQFQEFHGVPEFCYEDPASLFKPFLPPGLFLSKSGAWQ